MGHARGNGGHNPFCTFAYPAHADFEHNNGKDGGTLRYFAKKQKNATRRVFLKLFDFCCLQVYFPVSPSSTPMRPYPIRYVCIDNQMHGTVTLL